ncbi:hypothetical protein LINPERHAP2_LOCUS3685 [Linum perenne]
MHKPQFIVILESRISGDVGRAVRAKLKFQFSYIVDAVGFRGGIWMLWNDSNIRVNVLSSTNQFIHTSVDWDSGRTCLATFVYASPSLVDRRTLWQMLPPPPPPRSQAWLILGDFNSMIDSSEKLGGGRFNDLQAQEFRECIKDCNLLDTSFAGPRFTWFRGTLRERLDKCLYNAAWLDCFKDTTTYHLERIKSDHRPILVRFTNSSVVSRAPRPFRFNAAWLSHDDFPAFLDVSWKRGGDFCSSLQDLRDRCII